MYTFASTLLIYQDPTNLVGIGTATLIFEKMNRLPGFIGPVPPPLLIRKISTYIMFVFHIFMIQTGLYPF
ncbi:hypothetical protein M2298_004651 [Brevibacillus sp. 1238]|uniref:Uncharacterized protein n=1 Tax=Brevibacillus parabrevis TaxID=54914 RepID=A0A4Y3PMC2_BREPA|nr:hypothetical protein [Brevibacillus sp. 1238]GEB35630.1 hypothetical protein BPA01_52100 [Brevibacillus parabrevis]